MNNNLIHDILSFLARISRYLLAGMLGIATILFVFVLWKQADQRLVDSGSVYRNSDARLVMVDHQTEDDGVVTAVTVTNSNGLPMLSKQCRVRVELVSGETEYRWDRPCDQGLALPQYLFAWDQELDAANVYVEIHNSRGLQAEYPIGFYLRIPDFKRYVTESESIWERETAYGTVAIVQHKFEYPNSDDIGFLFTMVLQSDGKTFTLDNRRGPPYSMDIRQEKYFIYTEVSLQEFDDPIFACIDLTTMLFERRDYGDCP